MNRPGTFALQAALILGLNACTNGDKGANDTGGNYTIEDLYGTWSTDLMYWAGNQFNGANNTFDESHFLVEVDTVSSRVDGVEVGQDAAFCFVSDLVMNTDGTITATNMILQGEHFANFGIWVFEFTSRDTLIVKTGWMSVEEQDAGLPVDEATLTRASSTRAIDPADCEDQ